MNGCRTDQAKWAIRTGRAARPSSNGKAVRTRRLAAGAAGVLLAACGAAWALDAAPRPQPISPITTYGSVKEALRDGMRDYNAGDKAGAAQALEYAATQGHTLALWKL